MASRQLSRAAGREIVGAERDVGARQEAVKVVAAGCDDRLAEIALQVMQAGAIGSPRGALTSAATLLRFDPDDLGTQVGEQLGGEAPVRVGEVDHAHVIQQVCGWHGDIVPCARIRAPRTRLTRALLL